MVKTILGIILGAVFSYLFLRSGIKIIKAVWKYVSVKAECIDSNRIYMRRTTGYQNQYRFTYNGQEYVTESSPRGMSSTPKKGKYCNIYINPNNPDEIITDSEILSGILFTLFGVIGIGMVIAFIVYMII